MSTSKEKNITADSEYIATSFSPSKGIAGSVLYVSLAQGIDTDSNTLTEMGGEFIDEESGVSFPASVTIVDKVSYTLFSIVAPSSVVKGHSYSFKIFLVGPYKDQKIPRYVVSSGSPFVVQNEGQHTTITRISPNRVTPQDISSKIFTIEGTSLDVIRESSGILLLPSKGNYKLQILSLTPEKITARLAPGTTEITPATYKVSATLTSGAPAQSVVYLTVYNETEETCQTCEEESHAKGIEGSHNLKGDIENTFSSFSPSEGIVGTVVYASLAGGMDVPANSLAEVAGEFIDDETKESFPASIAIVDKLRYTLFSIVVPIGVVAERSYEFKIHLLGEGNPITRYSLVSGTTFTILNDSQHTTITGITPNRISVQGIVGKVFRIQGTALDVIRENSGIQLLPSRANYRLRILSVEPTIITAQLASTGNPVVPATYKVSATLNSGVPARSTAYLTVYDSSSETED